MDDKLLLLISQKLLQQQAKVTCAESCTAGLLSAALTELSGSSGWFDMGFVTYSNEAKMSLVAVQADTLKQFGAVSEQTAKEMAQGALLKASADYGIAISGIAGPTGGSPEKPVGTVCFAIATKDKVISNTQYFHGNRQAIRAQSVSHALQCFNKILDKEPC